MKVGFSVKSEVFLIGNGSFLHAFFSNVAYHLESGKWGIRFPVIMKELYQGKVEYKNIDRAVREVSIIKDELQKILPEYVIWDIQDLSKQPPWGTNISKQISDLGNYFVTCDGKDFLSVLYEALELAKKEKVNIEICLV